MIEIYAAILKQYFGPALDLALVMFASGLSLILLTSQVKRLRNTSVYIAGLMLLYSSIFPPYHAPDEADHFISYLISTNQDHLIKEAELSAQRAHFGEIVFNQEMPFQKEWINTIGNGFTPNVGPPDANLRSPMTVIYWRLIGTIAKSRPVEIQLLIVRLINSFLMLGVILICIYWLNMKEFLLLFTFIPSLPFFQMHVSNYSILISSYILLVSLIFSTKIHVAKNIHQNMTIGMVLGLTSLSFLLSGKLAIVMYFLTLPALSIQINEWYHKHYQWRRLGLVFSFFLVTWLGSNFFRNSVMTLTQYLPFELKLNIQPGLATFFFSSLLTLNLTITMMISPMINKFLDIMAKRSYVIQIFKWLTFIFFMSSLFFWKFGTRFQYENIEALPPPDTWSYLFKCLRSYILSFGVAVPDRNIVQYALVGFGWLDAIPPPIVSFILFAPISLIIFLAFLADNKIDHNRFIANCIFIGSLSVLQFLAVSWASLAQMMNLHGRYLLPIFIFQYIWIFEHMLSKIWRGRKDHIWYMSTSMHLGLIIFILFRYLGRI